MNADENSKGCKWCFSHNLKADDGSFLKIDSRRIRLSYLLARYKKHGNLANVSRDAGHRKVSTTADDYINKPEMVHVHENTVINGITNVINSSKCFLSKVYGDEENFNPQSDNIPTRNEEKKDVFFATCKDFYNDPKGEKNTPCKRPFGCIGCANAIFVSRHLPRLLALDAYLLDQRNVMSETDWKASLGIIYMTLHANIFSKFSDKTISEARDIANKNKYYMPMSPLELLK